MTVTNFSTRAETVFRRTYSRPLNPEGTLFETWPQTIGRVIGHQTWLWERAQGSPLTADQRFELAELRQLLLDRKVSMSGRTLWLGGTEVAKRREASQFNCSFSKVETVHDVVDCMWLLMQGCGVGFQPVVGTLNGFTRPMDVKVIRSTRTDKGSPNNRETYNADAGTWTIVVGDSAEAWAKSVGKLLAGKHPAETLVLDFTEIRPPGGRLAGYGWISQGDESLSRAFVALAALMNRRAGQLLTRMDILDLLNWLGTILSTRRSAEICLMDYGQPEWATFAKAKHEFWVKNPQRAQSNNSLVFRTKPTKAELTQLVDMMVKAGGSEPGFINAETATDRAPWFSGVNPCAEILLGNKSFCNLTELDVAKFDNDNGGMDRAIYLLARANYRQTLVNLDDGILQRAWHENNEYLRLCGVGITGVVRRPDLGPYDYRRLRNLAVAGAYAQADELGTQKPKNVTTVKPSGTLSKLMDTTEGVHKPLGRFIFNHINFSRHDPIVSQLREANYHVFDNPSDPSGVLVRFPVDWSGVEFDLHQGMEVNLDSAVSQLNRYKMLMDHYCEQNCSVTVSYAPEEAPAIVDWIYDNWTSYVGVSFLFRADPRMRAKDLGYAYLPQEVVTKQEYDDYVAKLKPVSLTQSEAISEDTSADCAGGVCPVR